MGRRRKLVVSSGSFVMKAYAGHRSGAVDGHGECRKQYGCVEQRSNDRSEEGQVCAVLFRPDHVMHGKSSGSPPKCTARLGHGRVATSLASVFFSE